MSEINLTHQMALIISKKGKFIAFGQGQKAPKRGHHNRILIVFNLVHRNTKLHLRQRTYHCLDVGSTPLAAHTTL